MQIRELDLTELQMAYDVLCELHTTLTYDEFEDLIYEMRSMEYKIFGIMEEEELITYAGVAIQTNLYDKRHLFIYDLVTSKKYRKKGYTNMMLEYLNDYAKMGMCENIVLSSGFQREDAHKFYEKSGFIKKSFVFSRSV